LKQAGWHENYKYDTQGYLRLYAKAGCPPPEPVIAFIECFGGLKILNAHAKPRATLEINLDPMFDPAFVQIICSDYDDYCKRIGLPVSSLYLIGASHQGYITLLMSSNGQVFGGYDEHLWKIGDNGEDAIEALCSGRDLLEV
jgi:hypothetical protein